MKEQMEPDIFPYMMMICAGFAMAFLGLAYKLAGAWEARPMAFSSIFLFTAAVLNGWRAVYEPTDWRDPRLWLLGSTMGFGLYVCLALVVLVNQRGPASLSWTLLNLSVLVPILLAPILLGDVFLRSDLLVVCLFVCMILSIRRGLAMGTDPVCGSLSGYACLLAAMFMVNGLFQFGSKLKDTLFQDRNAAGLAALFYGSGLIFAFGTHFRRERNLRFTRREWMAGLLAGACSGIGNLFLLHGMSLPVIVAFPIMLGIALTGGIALTTLFFKEPVNFWKGFSWALGLILLLFVAAREHLDLILRGSTGY